MKGGVLTFMWSKYVAMVILALLLFALLLLERNACVQAAWNVCYDLK